MLSSAGLKVLQAAPEELPSRFRPSPPTSLWQQSPPTLGTDAGDDTYSMQSLHQWLDHVLPDATTLALIIYRAGAAGVSLDDLRRTSGLDVETLDQFLRGLLATGQVVPVRVGGRLVFRAGM
jgi:hypothetical protein